MQNISHFLLQQGHGTEWLGVPVPVPPLRMTPLPRRAIGHGAVLLCSNMYIDRARAGCAGVPSRVLRTRDRCAPLPSLTHACAPYYMLQVHGRCIWRIVLMTAARLSGASRYALFCAKRPSVAVLAGLLVKIACTVADCGILTGTSAYPYTVRRYPCRFHMLYRIQRAQLRARCMCCNGILPAGTGSDCTMSTA